VIREAPLKAGIYVAACLTAILQSGAAYAAPDCKESTPPETCEMIERSYEALYVPHEDNYFGRYFNFMDAQATIVERKTGEKQYDYPNNEPFGYGQGQLWLALNPEDRQKALTYPPETVTDFLFENISEEKLAVYESEILAYKELPNHAKADWMSMRVEDRLEAAKIDSLARRLVFIDAHKGAISFDPRETNFKKIMESWKLFND